MKNKKVRVLFIAILCMLITGFFTVPISAASIEVIGNDTGLEIIPSSNKFFEELNLSPGDEKEGTVVIKNKYDAPFELFLKTERTDTASALTNTDLYKHLQITVTLKGEQIYSGNMSGFASGEGISLGIFEPNATEVMKITVKLPGQQTGNDYQNTEHNNKWIFTAVSKEKLPKTGMDIKTGVFSAAGVLLLTAGAFGIYRLRKSA